MQCAFRSLNKLSRRHCARAVKPSTAALPTMQRGFLLQQLAPSLLGVVVTVHWLACQCSMLVVEVEFSVRWVALTCWVSLAAHTLSSLAGGRTHCWGFFQSLARVGASVCGIDPGTSNITAARAHAALDSRVSGATRYVASSVEDFVGRGEQFDVVVSSEVIEHVADVPGFITCCASLVKVFVPCLPPG